MRAAELICAPIFADVVSGRVAPYAGARRVWSILVQENSEVRNEYLTFEFLASEWEDDQMNRDAYDEEIVTEAKRWIEAHASRF